MNVSRAVVLKMDTRDSVSIMGIKYKSVTLTAYKTLGFLYTVKSLRRDLEVFRNTAVEPWPTQRDRVNLRKRRNGEGER